MTLFVVPVIVVAVAVVAISGCSTIPSNRLENPMSAQQGYCQPVPEPKHSPKVEVVKLPDGRQVRHLDSERPVRPEPIQYGVSPNCDAERNAKKRVRTVFEKFKERIHKRDSQEIKESGSFKKSPAPTELSL